MDNEEMLPENDQDLQLSRRIRQALEAREDLSGIEDPFLSVLLEYKQSKQAEEAVISEPGGQLWKSIEKHTSPPSKSSYPVHRLFTGRPAVRAAAAVLITAVFIGVIYFQVWQRPPLIAETGAESLTINLAAGSRVTMRPYSKLFSLHETEQYRLVGEALFEITPDPGRTFSVEAGKGRVTVLGTTFMLSDWGELTRVYLEEGSVRFEKIDDTGSIILEPGQTSSISATGEILAPSFGDTAEFTDWLRNEMVFENKPARMIFRELEQHYNISISAPDSVQSARISGTLVLGTSDETLESLGTVLGGRFIPAGKSGYQYRWPE